MGWWVGISRGTPGGCLLCLYAMVSLGDQMRATGLTSK